MDELKFHHHRLLLQVFSTYLLLITKRYIKYKNKIH
jgi:hypothetical protein